MPFRVPPKLAMGRKYSAHYKMDHPRRGLAIIFNHEHFYNPELTIRNGTNQDAKSLKSAFQSLGFEVNVHKDAILSDIEYIIEKSIFVQNTDELLDSIFYFCNKHAIWTTVMQTVW